MRAAATEEGMHRKECVISRKQISLRISELGRQISADYEGHSLLMIGILNGAFIFMADLVRQIDLPLEIDFVRVSSYGAGVSSSGKVKFVKDVELPVAGKDVLLVEDIVDTGLTLFKVMEIFKDRNASSVRACVFIDKRERREHAVQIDYTGFRFGEGFLVGYGLDCAEQFRQIPDVCRLVKE